MTGRLRLSSGAGIGPAWKAFKKARNRREPEHWRIGQGFTFLWSRFGRRWKTRLGIVRFIPGNLLQKAGASRVGLGREKVLSTGSVGRVLLYRKFAATHVRNSERMTMFSTYEKT